MVQSIHAFSKVASGVYYTDALTTFFDRDCIEFLKKEAALSPQRRARLCAHPSPDAAHQSMLIVINRGGLVPPHRHLVKSETMTAVEGRAHALLFDDAGTPSKVVHMAPSAENGVFSYYMPTGVYHTIVPTTEWYVFLETTQGPFEASGMDIPPWSPSLDDQAACTAWRALCDAAIASLAP